MAEILYLTELMGLKVFDLKGKVIGRIRDASLVPLIDPARVDRFLVGGGWAWLSIRHDQVARITLDGIHLRDEKLTPYHNDEYMLRLVRDLLDQQIIDAEGRKVVRVTDITFEIQAVSQGCEELRVAEVDVGLRSVLRRLAQGAIPPRWIRRIQQPIDVHSIRWQFCNIVEPDPQRRLRLNITNELLEKMHPADIADIMEELGPEEREAIISSMDKEVAAETLSEADPEVSAHIIEALEPETAAEILEEMDPAEAAHMLDEIGEQRAGEILDELEDVTKNEVSEFMDRPDDSAGRLMTAWYVALPEAATVAEAMRALRTTHEDQLDTVHTLYLLDARERPVAAVPLARLLLSSGETPLASLAARDPVTIHASERQSRVIELFDKYNLLELPVVGEGHRLAGVISADDVITLLRQD
jgi:flagellar motility protein MotE (MotC chaperone)/sporulation protein YlmC with PRC-barrel domain